MRDTLVFLELLIKHTLQRFKEQTRVLFCLRFFIGLCLCKRSNDLHALRKITLDECTHRDIFRCNITLLFSLHAYHLHTRANGRKKRLGGLRNKEEVRSRSWLFERLEERILRLTQYRIKGYDKYLSSTLATMK